MSDTIPGFEASAWVGIGAPRNTPSDIIEKLNSEINDGLANPEIEARAACGFWCCGACRPSEPIRTVEVEDTKKWAKVIGLVDIKVE